MKVLVIAYKMIASLRDKVPVTPATLGGPQAQLHEPKTFQNRGAFFADPLPACSIYTYALYLPSISLLMALPWDPQPIAVDVLSRWRLPRLLFFISDLVLCLSRLFFVSVSVVCSLYDSIFRFSCKCMPKVLLFCVINL